MFWSERAAGRMRIYMLACLSTTSCPDAFNPNSLYCYCEGVGWVPTHTPPLELRSSLAACRLNRLAQALANFGLSRPCLARLRPHRDSLRLQLQFEIASSNTSLICDSHADSISQSAGDCCSEQLRHHICELVLRTYEAHRCPSKSEGLSESRRLHSEVARAPSSAILC